ncbi:MAG: ABC transporter substrate-binding protein [Pseudomonadota bacterium]
MQSLRVVQSERLALHFPVYLADELGFFSDVGIGEVEYLNTATDRDIYLRLVKGEAMLGIVDPVFTVDEEFEIEGTELCTLVDHVPLIVAGRDAPPVPPPGKDLEGCRIGVLPELTTSHTIGARLYGDRNEICDHDFDALVSAVRSGAVDCTVLLPEQMTDDLTEWWSLRRQFPGHAYKGLCASHFAPDADMIAEVKLVMDRALKFIHSTRDRAEAIFVEMFGNLRDPADVFSRYAACWPHEATVRDHDWIDTVKLWHAVYPDHFRNRHPAFLHPKPEEVLLSILASRKHCRDMPSQIPMLLDLLRDSVRHDRPLQMVTLWGAAEKSAFDNNDQRTMDHLTGIFDALRAQGIDVAPKLLLCNAHALTNGFPPEAVTSYAAEVAAEAQRRDLEVFRLADLWQQWGLTSEGVRESAAADGPSRLGLAVDDKLVTQAKKHYHGSDPAFGAAVYLTMRGTEAPHLAQRFPDHVVVSYSDRSAEAFLPNLPAIYTWSIGKKETEAPWFMAPVSS